MTHECVRTFKTEKIDNCSGNAFHRCYGIEPMYLEVYNQGKDGQEMYVDEWNEISVNFCPYCGLKAEREKCR
jgi:hypothetical protein